MTKNYTVLTAETANIESVIYNDGYNSDVLIDRFRSWTPVLKSYSSIVALVVRSEIVYLFDDWDYSPTTMRHVRKFLRETYGVTVCAADIRAAMQTGDYIDGLCFRKADGYMRGVYRDMNQTQPVMAYR